jgi:radical SAM superfamily enzyme YgiQ (UPF0313 family)
MAAGFAVDSHTLIADVEHSSQLAACQTDDLIGIGLQFTSNLPYAIELAERVRSVAPGAHITMGGAGTVFAWEDILRSTGAVDSVVTFEGEETIVELASRLRDGDPVAGIRGLYSRGVDGAFEFSGHREPPSDLDSVARPDRNIAGAVDPGHFSVLTSRGCSAHCTFCQSGNYGNRYHSQPRWRARSSADVVAELNDLASHHSATAVSFVDDDFLGACSEGRTRGLAFVEDMASFGPQMRFAFECRVDEVEQDLFTGLKKVGLAHVFIGIDSGNEEDLAQYVKRIRDDQVDSALAVLRGLDLSINFGFIMFNPSSHYETLSENIDFLARHELGGFEQLTNHLEIYPGSPLLAYYGRRGYLFKRESFMHTYTIRDLVARATHSVTRRTLEPLYAVETNLKRLHFDLQVRSLNSFDVDDLEREVWRVERDSFRECLEAARNAQGPLTEAFIDEQTASNESAADAFSRRTLDLRAALVS